MYSIYAFIGILFAMVVKFYQTNSGRSPVMDFIKGLDKQDKSKVLGVLQNIERLGLESNRCEFRQIEGKLLFCFMLIKNNLKKHQLRKLKPQKNELRRF